MDIDEEEDELIEECDIIYTGEYSNEINLFQFPLIPKENLNIKNCNNLSINQEHFSIKLDFNLDKNYLNQYYQNYTNIQSMKGEKIDPNSNLCIGIFKNNKLFLTPISYIYQFKHDFSNLEKNNLNNKKINKKDFKNNLINNTDLTNIEYSSLKIFQEENLETYRKKEEIINEQNDYEKFNKNENSLDKKQYFNLLLKYVVEDINNPELIKYNNNNNDFDLNLNENISFNSNFNNKMIFEDEQKNEKKDEINTKNIQNLSEENKNYQENNFLDKMISSTILKIFGNNDCLFYEDLLRLLSDELKIKENDLEGFNKIKKYIENFCLIVKGNYCYYKNLNDDETNLIRIKLIEFIGNTNGVKKQQIKSFLSKNKLTIQDNKLNKILKTFCEFSNSLWIIKTPEKKN